MSTSMLDKKWENVKVFWKLQKCFGDIFIFDDRLGKYNSVFSVSSRMSLVLPNISAKKQILVSYKIQMTCSW